jgi:hypothetical protein
VCLRVVAREHTEILAARTPSAQSSGPGVATASAPETHFRGVTKMKQTPHEPRATAPPSNIVVFAYKPDGLSYVPDGVSFGTHPPNASLVTRRDFPYV